MQYALLLDGGFLLKKLESRLGRFPEAEDILAFCERVRQHGDLVNHHLLRIYFYDAPPVTATWFRPSSSPAGKA